MADASLVQMGVCQVLLDGVDLGHTHGGVTASYEPTHEPVTVDKYGDTPVDYKLKGEMWKVKVPLAEYTVANIKKAIAHGTLTGAGNARMTLGSQSGKGSSGKTGQLVLHPIDAGASLDYDICLYKAFPTSTIELSHTVDGHKIIEVEFTALIDETKSDGNYLGFIGDSTA